ncbi:hypothetical protein ACG98G_00205 [Megasphaera hexanoica]|uniref:Uncharacterized protein n=1 Tax=Megasphaera hexanoica TaxID=1675036 RepID=A0ABW7DRG1_9FIRM|nr:hypothetical protein [Megasphaera hexanoica]AXB81780.1 hypothetical protein ACT01_05795 [Megasphaera hexanoica]
MMNRFRQIANEITAILEDEFPDMTWKSAVLGPAYPKTLTGYVCCDTITFDPFTKSKKQASATFTIEVICPNPKEKADNTQYIEDLAMEINDVLTENKTIDGWADDSRVEKIVFATPAGRPEIGIAIFTFTVEYEE